MMDEIFKITKDGERAEDLFIMAKERLEMISFIPRDKTYKIIEECYEIIKELITAIMYIDGYKTLSHVELINYFRKNYSELDDSEIQLVDSLRKFRHGIVYYGKKISSEFLENNEKMIQKIISKLIKFTEKGLKNEK